MALRSGWVVLGVATAATFAAGWYTAFVTAPVAAGTPVAAVPGAVPAAVPTAAPVEDPTFKTKIVPFVNKYCNTCHNSDKAAGGLTLDSYTSEAHARKDRKTWATVQHAIAAGEMPPKRNKAQPTKDEREFVINWIETTLTKIDCTAPKDPGRVTLRRLNRAEYNNTVRDLCGVDFQPAEDFPADDVGYGFDNIGDVLSFQPILLEKYLTAADKVLEKALAVPPAPRPEKTQVRMQSIQTVPRDARQVGADKMTVRKILFRTNGTAFIQKKYLTAEGEYFVRLRAWGTAVDGAAPKIVLRAAGRELATFTVDAPEGKLGTYQAKGRLPAGDQRFEFEFVNAGDPKNPRQFGIEQFEIDGPHDAAAPAPPPLARDVLAATPTAAAGKAAAAEKFLAEFARRAYRRPAKAEEVRRLVKLFEVADAQGEPFIKAVALPIKAVLVSPHFLYRIEDDPKDADGVRTIGDYELATRLSYFLWSSMPDEELFKLAAANRLRAPGVLQAQVKRMLTDPKAKALGQNFAAQWLMLRSVPSISPDKGYFPTWDATLQAAMVKEAELFFEHVVSADRPVTDFLDSDYTFLNERLANHYGIGDVKGPDFRKVTFPDRRRGGVITMASTLTVTSNPTRTSPVKRGKWILENILGTPPPPPPPDAGELPPTDQLKGTVRQQMEQHRENPQCATCHARLDPLGLGLENFDAVGRWRTTDNKAPVDASGVLPDGSAFDGPAQMRQVLLKKGDQFRRCLAEKLLTFALGRGLEYYDKCAVDEAVAKLARGGDRFSAMVLAVVESEPFQKRKGKRSE